jgi:hypothetical protein
MSFTRTTIPGDFDFRPAIILMRFIRDNYNETEAGVSKNLIKFNQWPSGQVEITLKCSSLVCNVNNDLDPNQLLDPFRRYFSYKELINIDLFQYSTSNEIYPQQLDNIAQYLNKFIKDNRTSLKELGIYEIYVSSNEHPTDSKKNRFHYVITVAMKYTKTEIFFNELDMFPQTTGNEPIKHLDMLPENEIMNYIINQYPETETDPRFVGIIPKSQVRFKQQYNGQGTVAISIANSRNTPNIIDNSQKLEFNNPEILITADIVSTQPSAEDEQLGNQYWNIRRFLEYIFRMPRALRSRNIPLVELTRIVERDSVPLNTSTYKGDVFRIFFYCRLTYLLNLRKI